MNDKIFLFYDGYEMKAIDAPFGSAMSWARGMARYAYRTLKRKQPYTGYYTAFTNLVRSLEAQGYTVSVNDFAEARRNPRHPIGVCGYRSVFEKIKLPNPALIFHADFGYPNEALGIIGEVNARLFAPGCPWVCRLHAEHLPGRLRPLFIGIDTEEWPDLSDRTKSIDYLIYDKIRWRRTERVPSLLDPLRAELDRMDRSYVTLRYGHHHLKAYRKTLSKARAMIFLCEHETQGIAYQEAMSSNLPILAWDEGELVDPRQKPFFHDADTVSSVPYFDESCGMTFQAIDMAGALAKFDKMRGDFAPRRFVESALSLEAGAKAFIELYEEVGRA